MRDLAKKNKIFFCEMMQSDKASQDFFLRLTCEEKKSEKKRMIAKLLLLLGFISTGWSFPPPGLPTLADFNWNTDVISQTATGIAAIKTTYPIKTATVHTNTTLAIDKENGRMLVDAGINGISLFLPTITYVTIPSPYGMLCGFVNLSFNAEIEALSLMNNKGILYNLQPTFPFFIPVKVFSGYASDNTQCQTSIAYSWYVDSNGLVRQITADTPLDVQGTVEVIAQSYIYEDFHIGEPSSSLFAIPAICDTPFDWCERFFPDGDICLYPPGTFS